MKVLGIHDGHSASACLVDDGKVVAAIQEERLVYEKNRGGYPERAIGRVLATAGVELADVDRVAFSTREFRNLNMRNAADVMATYGRMFTDPSGQRALESEDNEQQQQRLRSARLTEAGFPAERIQFVDHHTCHATTAYFARGTFDRNILVITNDGHGDGLCATVSIGRGGELTRLASVPKDDSIAAIYSYITYLLGFTPLEHEYKLMGMAPYAEDSGHAKQVCDYFESLFELHPEQPLLWRRTAGTTPVSALAPEIEKAMRFRRFDAMMAGLQMFTENLVTRWVARVVEATGVTDLALAGGIFMNVKLNHRIADLPGVRSAFFCPSAGDESNSFGAAWSLGGVPEQGRPLPHLYLGTGYTRQECEKAVADHSFRKRVRVIEMSDPDEQCALLLADRQIVARFAGRMEFGARALGNRSILANASDPDACSLINRMIKRRDFWMPFAPTILAEHADEYLVPHPDCPAEYMALAFDVRLSAHKHLTAATHPHDHTCRPQILTAEANPAYHRLISLFREHTGIGGVLNTSFNLHGYPIVETPEQALDVFDSSGLNYLAIEHLLVQEVSEDD
ncbi:carbamoyltransferase C-terminal domain-containing protein [Kutzneria albida]|uniref:Carbamoyl transferase, NodU family n=1 Tax=Kutzneria albida DSM 43870 TaxID=1449976 RepID=W5W2H5_9PSEU|nr:carbamoyltransferase C-terminal domain-containing protein [Kutzneria albida]AHH95388.1 carbamoyl transferase, NodU family [Kutzneria albida DSM 43870]